MKKIIFYQVLVLGSCLISDSGWAQNGSEEAFPAGTYQAPEWTITFTDDGQYEVYLMDGTSISGTYEAEGGQVKVKDSSCGDVEGVYAWKLEEDSITFEAVEDACATRRDSSSGLILKRIEDSEKGN